jgi:hypothetical protein
MSMIRIGRKYWFLPDRRTGLSEEWPVENGVWGPVLGQFVSEDACGVSFQSGGRIYFTTVNDCFFNEDDAKNEYNDRLEKGV